MYWTSHMPFIFVLLVSLKLLLIYSEYLLLSLFLSSLYTSYTSTFLPCHNCIYISLYFSQWQQSTSSFRDGHTFCFCFCFLTRFLPLLLVSPFSRFFCLFFLPLSTIFALLSNLLLFCLSNFCLVLSPCSLFLS